MGRPATFLFCAGLLAVFGVAACGVEKAKGTIAISASGGAGGAAGSAAGGMAGGAVAAAGGRASGGAGGHGGFAAGGAMGHDPIGCGGSAPAAVPQYCVPSIDFAIDGAAQPYPRCQAGAVAIPEICDETSAVYHCPFGYSTASSCGCFIHDIDQDCPDAGTD